MSKSIKKFPIIKQEKVNKKDWNKKVRNLKINLLDEESWEDECSFKGHQYQKLFPNWSTWQYRWSLDDVIYNYYAHPERNSKSLEEWIEYWKRCCLRK